MFKSNGHWSRVRLCIGFMIFKYFHYKMRDIKNINHNFKYRKLTKLSNTETKWWV